ncbi:inositol monophosphatase family protein [Candidatus Pelagibacter communis]|uniref:inositol monophosphatase family protein n=1 Tax=Pelagibacter ubique TaxID=198252 RepID=UPI00094C99DE|nr:inositol monophosphatase family protein [Candidatus Pelagibacter ubique]
MNSISPNLNLMIKASEKASKILIRDFGEVEKLQVSLKGPNNFVTNADRKVEKIIIEELEKSKKNFSILTEETGFIKNKDKDNFWIIDPIDGTTNFLNGVPHFCISIALLFEKEIIAGVIYDPIKDEIFYAEKNGGSFLNNKSIRVSKKNNISGCLYGVNFRKNLPENLIIRNTGSAALDLAYVSCGRFDGCFQKNVNLWDIAAGTVLIKEAGGIVDKFDLKKFNKISIKASNERISSDLNKKISIF